MVYIHVPFCRSFCVYCDFYSELACKGSDRPMMEAYTKSLLAEIDERRAEIDATQSFNTLYIGGGTPSVLPLDLLGRIVSHLGIGDTTEFTIEVNPDDIVERGEAYVDGLRDLGVTRVSMGVQSLDNAVLRSMNRRHDAATALKAFEMLRRVFDNISVDLIFGGLGVTKENLSASLDALLPLRPCHVSAYQLSIEDGSALARMCEDGRYKEYPDADCASQYALLCSRLAEAGYEHYEISNWAFPRRHAIHNSAYWTRAPYVGLGPGAHSFDGTSVRSWNSSDSPTEWIRSCEKLSDAQSRIETIMLGLRTAKGVALSECDNRLVSELVSEDLLEFCGPDSTRVRIPERHLFVSDSVIERLI